jgi:hypothetical protein
MFFKIRAKTNGRYSTKGNFPCFTEKGEHWTSPEDVAKHLKQLSINGRVLYRTLDVELVEIEVEESSIRGIRFVEKGVFPLI